MDSMLNFHLRTKDWIVPAVDLRKLNETLYAVFVRAAASGETPDLNGFTKLFSSVITKTLKAHGKKYAEFDCKEKAIYEFCGITIEELGVADFFELRCLRYLFGELKQDLDEIQKLDTLNESALEEVHTKLLIFQQRRNVDDAEFQTWWHNNKQRRIDYAARINKILAKIEEEYHEARQSIHRASIRVTKTCEMQNLFYPSIAIDAIRKDSDNILSIFLADDPSSANCPLIYALFRYSIDCRASRCAYLLSLAPELGLIVNTDCLNHLILSAASQKAEGLTVKYGVIDFQTESAAFGTLLSHLGTETNQAFVIEKMDLFLGNVLHYVAFYGLATLCRAIMCSLEHVKVRGITARRAVLLKNFEGYTPLALAVFRNHLDVAKILVGTLIDGPRASGDAGEQEISEYLGDLLLVAVRLQLDDMVRLLLDHKASLLSRTSQGYTSIYLAAQLNRTDYIELFKSNFSFRYMLNAGEPLLNWTPLFIASIEDNTDVVNDLIKAGADQDLTDARGWTASDYIAHKGSSISTTKIGVDYSNGELARIASSIGTNAPSPELVIGKQSRLRTNSDTNESSNFPVPEGPSRYDAKK
ncbi:hypothetical protein KEM54_003902 [Ascosphaera aggregata]|nr:hypothetical protein KEM54_003902 [Ascosphaera aggregata]